jgi:hypothetical protein
MEIKSMYKVDLITEICKYMDMSHEIPYDITELETLEVKELKYKLEIMKQQAK